MARWNPVVFSRCTCAEACPTGTRFEPLGRSRAAVHVVVHHPLPDRRVALPAVSGPATLGPGALPLLLLGAAAFLLATLDSRTR